MSTETFLKFRQLIEQMVTSGYKNDEKIFWDELKQGMKIVIDGCRKENASCKLMNAKRLDIQ